MAYFLDKFSVFVPCFPYSDRSAFFVPLLSPFFTIRVENSRLAVFATFFVLATHFDFAIRVPHGERTVIGSVFFYPLPSESSIGIESGPLSIGFVVLEASFVNKFAILGKTNGFLLTIFTGVFGELKSIR